MLIAPASIFRSSRLGSSLGFTILVALLVILSACSSSPTGEAVLDPGSAGGKKVDLQVFVMAQCPFGVQAENALIPVIERIGPRVNLTVEFIGDGSASDLRSLHGPDEVRADMIQAAAQEVSPASLPKFLLCLNEDPKSISSRWEACAARSGVDAGRVHEMVDGSRGKELLAESFKRSAAAGVSGSPTIMIDGVNYEGGRDGPSLFAAICAGFGKDRPDSCADAPKPFTFDVIIVNDKDCEDCSSAPIEGGLRRFFPGARFINMDVASPEGKGLVSQFGLERVPSFLVDGNLSSSDEWRSNPDLQSAFEYRSGRLKLRDAATGAVRLIDPAKRAAFEESRRQARLKSLEALGVAKGDGRPQVDFFVMSYCPYGDQAEEALKLVWDALRENAEFVPHYVVYTGYQGGSDEYCMGDGAFCSMHGIQELHQDVRELCVRDISGMESWFRFALAMNKDCSASDADSCWEPVAEKIGLDVARIKSCQEEDAIALLKKEKALGDQLGVQGSPSVFMDGEPFGGARSPEGYRKGLCSLFKDQPAGCSSPLPRGSDSASDDPAPSGQQREC